MSNRAEHPILGCLRVPVVAARMLIVSGPALVIAACRAGIIGSFPTANPRGDGELELWLDRIESALRESANAGEAGHSVSGVLDVPPVAEVVDRLAEEYARARATTVARTGLAAGTRGGLVS